MAVDEEEKPEIIIIKRIKRGGGGHHGGAWKIAFADFMTAMMAFFLVMWLINASNEATRAQVASYFNPVKLIDSTAQPRGLTEKDDKPKTTEAAKEKVTPSKEKKTSDQKTEKEESENKEKAQKSDEEKKKEEEEEKTKETGAGKFESDIELFRSPMETLDKIAGNKSGGHDAGKGGAKSGAETGKLKAHKFKDPFAPKTWKILKIERQAIKQKPKPAEKTKTIKKVEKKPKSKSKHSAEKLVALEKSTNKSTDKIKNKTAEKIAEKTAGKITKKIVKKLKEKNKTKSQKPRRKKSDSLIAKSNKKPVGKKVGDGKSDAKTISKLSKLKSELKSANKGKHPKVDVTRSKKGILVSLTDDTQFGMFKVASAEPAKEMVLFMENIAKVLAKKPGKIIIRGHTDGRPFNSKDYDNWRLSTARAQIARYMLLRGGIKEERIVRIEGYADRKLKVADKPFDARNRRIEILILD